MLKVIEINNLSKRYKEFQVVNKISLEINEGEMFGFIGPNGEGKSTLSNMIRKKLWLL